MRRPPRRHPRPARLHCLAPGAALTGLLLAAALSPPSPAGALPAGGPTRVATVSGTPWEIAVVPGGGAFVTQRDGGIVYLDAQDQLQSAPALARTAIPSVTKLLGLALAPDFATTGTAYVYVVQGIDPDGSGPANGQSGIWRLKATGGSLSVVGKVFGGIDSDGSHDGGRMVFGPDGHLYVSTGDVHQPSRPQDPASLNGKILRLSVPSSGPLTAPADNPFAGGQGGAPWVWSLGHRHPQGLAFDAAGRLWESEHGPSGETYQDPYLGGANKSGRDELNLIVKQGNYGWPLVSGTDNRPGMIPPAAVAAPATSATPAWAPGDLAVGADGSLYAPFLNGQELRRFDVRTGAVFAQGTHLTGLGRLRVAVARGSDLLVAQDRGSDAVIYRVPLGAPVAGGSDAATPVLGSGTSTSAPRSAPVSTAVAGAASAGDGMRTRTRSLARKLRSAVREAGTARLAAGRPVVIRGAVPSTGMTMASLRLRGADGRVLGRARVVGEAGKRARLRLRVSTAGRAMLRAGATRLVVRVTHRPPGGAAYTVDHRVRLTRS